MNTKPDNTGIINDPRTAEEKAKDYIAGTPTGLDEPDKIPSGVWDAFLPLPEAQFVQYMFDTESCVSFSLGHVLEANIIWMLLNDQVPANIIQRMKDLKFFGNPADYRTFRISKRALAIMSGTTKQGNYFQKVADTIRNLGFVPDSLVPMSGTSWELYMNPAVITPAVAKVAVEMASYFNSQYQFLPYDASTGISSVAHDAIEAFLKKSPLQIGIPVPAYHAIVMTKLTDSQYGVMDTYPPFFYNDNIGSPFFNYALQLFVSLKTYSGKILRKGMPVCADVMWVQNELGIKSDGIFGAQTEQAVKDFQSANGLTVDGVWGPASQKKWSDLKKK